MALNLTKLQKHELFTCYSSYQWLSPWVAVCMHGERCAHAPPSAPPGAAVPPFQVLSSDSAPRCAAPPGDLTPEVPCCCVLFLRGSIREGLWVAGSLGKPTVVNISRISAHSQH